MRACTRSTRSAVKMEAVFAKSHPPLRMEIPACAGDWVVLCNGMTVFSPENDTPFEVDQTVHRLATNRCCEFDIVDSDYWLVDIARSETGVLANTERFSAWKKEF